MKNYLSDVISFLTHLIPAALVAIGHQLVSGVALWIQVTLLVLIVAIMFFIYKLLLRYRSASEKEPLVQEIEGMKEEMRKLQRYSHLRKSMLDVLVEFLRVRYRASYSLANELRNLVHSGNVSTMAVKAALENADNERREKVKESLGRVSELLKEDTFMKPIDADGDSNDKMGVSFYAVVEKSGSTKVLEPRYRNFPNEGKPKTKKFEFGEGAAGKAWRDEKVVICENGGEDQLFKIMRDGQANEYASMICVPAMADFIKEKTSEVFGILTIHSTQRRGYFQARIEQFWFDLFQPVCDMIIYSAKSSDLIQSIAETTEAIALGRETEQQQP